MRSLCNVFILIFGVLNCKFLQRLIWIVLTTTLLYVRILFEWWLFELIYENWLLIIGLLYLWMRLLCDNWGDLVIEEWRCDLVSFSIFKIVWGYFLFVVVRDSWFFLFLDCQWWNIKCNGGLLLIRLLFLEWGNRLFLRDLLWTDNLVIVLDYVYVYLVGIRIDLSHQLSLFFCYLHRVWWYMVFRDFFLFIGWGWLETVLISRVFLLLLNNLWLINNLFINKS